MTMSNTAEKNLDSDELAFSQYLTFILAGEVYGIDILKIREIKGWMPVTRIPNVDGDVLGVLNMRGIIVPIIDLRIRFKLENVEYISTTAVVVLSVEAREESRTIGVVVDNVSDVLNISSSDIKSSPDFGSKIETRYIKGIAATDQNVVMILDMDKLLSEDELDSLDKLD